MKLWVLSENTACGPEFGTEHGLSMMIETGGHRILFDTGASDCFVKNARTMGVDLAAAEACVISHGHNDHGGGLEAFLQVNGTAPVYIQRSAFERHFSSQGRENSIAASVLMSGRARFADGETELFPGVTIFRAADLPMTEPVDSAGLTELCRGELKPDEFLHEQYLLVQEGRKKIVISGCSHRGILNIARAFRPDAIVGGFHFFKIAMDEAGKARLERAGRELRSLVKTCLTCHCTGTEQYAFLKTVMGDGVRYLSSGAVTEI